MKLSPLVVSLSASIAVLFLFGATVHADITLNGQVRVDTSYTTDSQENTGSSSTDNTIYDQTGRVKLVPSIRTESGSLFIEAKAEIMANQDGDPSIDDAWGKIGTSKFDLQLGRFEGWDMFPKSNDMLIVSAPGGPGRYETNYARGRMGSTGQFAMHVLPSDAFGLEVGLIYGQDSEDLDITSEPDAADPGAVDVNVVGIRPVISSKFGPVEFGVGADMITITKQDDNGEGDISKVGFGAKVKSSFNIVTIGINYASGTVSKTYYDMYTSGTEEQPDETTNSLGSYVDLAIGDGVLSFAGFMTNWESDDAGEYDREHTQFFIAYAHPLPIKGAAIKFAVSQASATDDDPGVGDSDALGFKVRLQYDF
jgi:hypothetical protein